MDTYKAKSVEVSDDSQFNDSLINNDSSLLIDSLDTLEQIISNDDIVSGNFDYESLDKKVTEIETDNKSITKGNEPRNNPAESSPKIKEPSKAVNRQPADNQSVNYPSDNDGMFMVIAGSFLLKENADAIVSKLKKSGYPDSKVVIFTASQYHSVLAARYHSEDKARAVSAQLKQKGIDNFVKVSQ